MYCKISLNHSIFRYLEYAALNQISFFYFQSLYTMAFGNHLCVLSSFAIGCMAIATRHCVIMSWLNPISTILLGTSIWYHSIGNLTVMAFDKILTHIMGLGILLHGVHLTFVSSIGVSRMHWYLYSYWTCYGYVFWVYYISKMSHLSGIKWKPWHASIHIIGSLGTVFLAFASDLYFIDSKSYRNAAN
jgi:hypothetical protein